MVNWVGEDWQIGQSFEALTYGKLYSGVTKIANHVIYQVSEHKSLLSPGSDLTDALIREATFQGLSSAVDPWLFKKLKHVGPHNGQAVAQRWHLDLTPIESKAAVKEC